MKNSVGIFLLGAALAVGLVSSAVVVTVYITKTDNKKIAAFDKAAKLAADTATNVTRSKIIRVKGSASQKVRSDYGSWSGSVATAAPTREEALVKLSAAEKKIEEYITSKEIGFKKENIVWNSISVSVIYCKNEKGIATNEIHHFQAERSLEIESADVDRLEKLNRHFTDLVKSGIAVGNHGSSYVITNLDDYKMKLLRAATENGYARAKALAESANGKVGALLSASQGIFQVLAPGGGNISDYGTYDKSTIDKEIKAVVTLEFSSN